MGRELNGLNRMFTLAQSMKAYQMKLFAVAPSLTMPLGNPVALVSIFRDTENGSIMIGIYVLLERDGAAVLEISEIHVDAETLADLGREGTQHLEDLGIQEANKVLNELTPEHLQTALSRTRKVEFNSVQMNNARSLFLNMSGRVELATHLRKIREHTQSPDLADFMNGIILEL